MRRCLILACCMALLPALAAADEVVLKGGGRISGQIVSRTDTAVAVNVGAGIVTVPMTSVLRIEEGRSVLDDYDDRLAKLRADDAAGWLELAKWSASQGLGTQARRAYERVAALDPQNVDANLALGRVLLEGRWVSEQESYRARGLVPFEGEWITPAERDSILRQRDAAWQAEIARVDAVRAARDAEVERLQAEVAARNAEALAPWYSVGLPFFWGTWPAVVPGGYPVHGRGRKGRHGINPYQPPPSWPQMGTFPSQPIGGVLSPLPNLAPPPPPAVAPRTPPRPSGRPPGQANTGRGGRGGAKAPSAPGKK